MTPDTTTGMVLETDRLVLRRFTDAKRLFELGSDPGAVPSPTRRERNDRSRRTRPPTNSPSQPCRNRA